MPLAKRSRAGPVRSGGKKSGKEGCRNHPGGLNTFGSQNTLVGGELELETPELREGEGAGGRAGGKGGDNSKRTPHEREREKQKKEEKGHANSRAGD